MGFTGNSNENSLEEKISNINLFVDMMEVEVGERGVRRWLEGGRKGKRREKKAGCNRVADGNKRERGVSFTKD